MLIAIRDHAIHARWNPVSFTCLQRLLASFSASMSTSYLECLSFFCHVCLHVSSVMLCCSFLALKTRTTLVVCWVYSSIGIFTLTSRFGHSLARPAISLSCLCKTEGVKSPIVMETAFLVQWRRCGYAWRVDLFRIICIIRLILFFYDSRDLHVRLTSECRLQTRLTILVQKLQHIQNFAEHLFLS